MWHSIIEFLLNNPIVSIFLCLCIGYYVGKFTIKSFSLGSTVGVLLAGLIIGQIGTFTIPPILKSVFFDLFIFVIGYEVGPAFIQSLKKSGIKLVIQAVFFSGVAFTLAFGIFKALNINPGEAGGIIAGALTQSATIGTATSAISSLGISAAEKTVMTSNVAIAYAVTYVFGTMGVVIFLKNVAPIILRVNLKEETKKVVEELDFTGDKGASSPLLSNLTVRSFKITNDLPANTTVKNFEKQYKEHVIVEQLFSAKKPKAFNENTLLTSGDVITVISDSQDLFKIVTSNTGLKEVFDEAYKNLSLKTVDVMLTKVFTYHIVENLSSSGIVITDAEQEGKAITDYTQLRAGNHLTIVGPERAVNMTLPKLGYATANGPETDISYLSIGVVIGLLIGALVLTVKGVPLTLGAGGGALFSGLFFGWYQSQHAKFGNIPSSTRWFLKSVGLNLFIAAVGLEAGSQFITALQSMGIQVLLIGAVLSIVPHLLALLFGKYVLKLNAVENIGSLAGAGTINAALNAVNEETGSSVFALSFTPSYAIGNILITVMGPLIVALLAG